MPKLRKNIANHEVGQVAEITKRGIGVLVRVFSERFQAHDCSAIGLAQVWRPTGIIIEPIEQDVCQSSCTQRSLGLVEFEFRDRFPGCRINGTVTTCIDSNEDIAFPYVPNRRNNGRGGIAPKGFHDQEVGAKNVTKPPCDFFSEFLEVNER